MTARRGRRTKLLSTLDRFRPLAFALVPLACGQVSERQAGAVGTAGMSGSGGSPPSVTTPAAAGAGGAGGAGGAVLEPTGLAGEGGAGSEIDGDVGGAAGAPGGGAGGAGGAGDTEVLPPPQRSGPFKMLVYSRTEGYRHAAAIDAGKLLLQQIADEQGFSATFTEENALLTELASYEILFFLNPSGNLFSSAEKTAFEAWMRAGGAFAGVHAATDVENAWPFYSEITGQYHNGHARAGSKGTVVLAPSALTHPALQGLPSPWERSEEWFLFKSFPTWSLKPGFEILATVSAPGEPYDGHPVSWTREYLNFRSFYTSLGHDAVVYEDPSFKQHLTGGIMWAVRRETLIQ